jgi:hypothetical protein
MTNQERKYPLDFRRDETAYVMEQWLGSQSYLGNALGDWFRAIIIDPNMLGPLSASGENSETLRAWSAYELMMHRLFLAFYPFDLLTKDEAQRFYEAYESLQDGTNPLYSYMALRYFELALEYLFRRGARIVFMFDEFEEMYRLMPVKFFQNLRGLRDSHKSQLAYLTFTRTPLNVTAQHYSVPSAEIESFNELFTDTTYFVGPYNDSDATRMMAELAKRAGKGMSQEMSRLLIQVTGGYAGLLRSSFTLIDSNTTVAGTQDNMQAMSTYLVTRQPIRTECRTIWSSLTPSEQYVLRAVARVASYDVNLETELAINQLMQKKLLRLDKGSNHLSIHPPLFSLYVLNHWDET